MYKRCVPPRFFLLGTDTDCGKTTLACALVRAGWAAGVRVLPFKPVASGPDGPDGDPERLAAAAAPLGLRPEQICPLRYAEAIAPGIADDPSRFLRGPALDLDVSKDMSAGAGTFAPVLKSLEALETATRPVLTLIEGAGGLWVPMPGGTWLPGWIAGLGATPIVVGRLGLGTINHTLLTIGALRRLGLPPRGFFLVETDLALDPSRRHNAAVIAIASGLPCLGVLPHGHEPAGWLAPETWANLTAPERG